MADCGLIDKDANGQPDDCQYAYGDFDLSGDIGGGDLAVLLVRWGLVQCGDGVCPARGRVCAIT